MRRIFIVYDNQYNHYNLFIFQRPQTTPRPGFKGEEDFLNSCGENTMEYLATAGSLIGLFVGAWLQRSQAKEEWKRIQKNEQIKEIRHNVCISRI